MNEHARAITRIARSPGRALEGLESPSAAADLRRTPSTSRRRAIFEAGAARGSHAARRVNGGTPAEWAGEWLIDQPAGLRKPPRSADPL